MEAMMVGKPRSVAIGALRALVTPLRERWGDVQGFVALGLDVLAREGSGVLYSEKDSPAHLEQVYRQVVRARATYFRSVENTAQLEHLYKELDLSAAKATSPLQQGVLWLASRLQQQAIAFLQDSKTAELKQRVLEEVGAHRGALTKAIGDPEQLTLDRVEAALAAFAQDALGGTLGPFEGSSLAGHLLEIVREAARKPPLLDVAEDQAPRNDILTPLLAELLEPVKRAELNEARLRYARYSEEEKNRRYNEFRRQLQRIIGEVAPFAPNGFEAFCHAVEMKLYPYPEPLQFIRTYARPIWNNGAQSSLFANCTTPPSVQHTYDTLLKARQGNPVVLELARAFAVRNFSKAGSEDKGPALTDLDLKAEFGWPTTLGEMQSAL